MPRDIHSIRDDGGGRVCHGSSFRKHSNCIRDAQRETAAAPSAGRNASHRLDGIESHFSKHRRTGLSDFLAPSFLRQIYHSDYKVFSRTDVQRNIATVIDVRPAKISRCSHRRQNLFRYGAGYSGHRRDEVLFSVRQHSGVHAPSDDSARFPASNVRLLSQQWKFAAEFIEHGGEAVGCGAVSSLDLIFAAKGLKDDVNRSILQMQSSAVREYLHSGSGFHDRVLFPLPASTFPVSKGHGFSGRADR
jgi:hypothetical protein